MNDPTTIMHATVRTMRLGRYELRRLVTPCCRSVPSWAGAYVQACRCGKVWRVRELETR